MEKSALARVRRESALRDDAGAAAVEFALILPVVLLLLFGIIEFGRAWNVKQVLTDAAREGARVAVVNNVMSAAALQPKVTSTVREAAARAGLDTIPATLDIQLSGIPGGTNTPATVALKYDYTPLFGTWVLKSSTVPIRSVFRMRNE
jgi:Flp pilus assembly protein TadG